jgi:hypothetical protein
MTRHTERYSIASLKFGHLQEGLAANVMSGQQKARVAINTTVSVTFANELAPSTQASLARQAIPDRSAKLVQFRRDNFNVCGLDFSLHLAPQCGDRHKRQNYDSTRQSRGLLIVLAITLRIQPNFHNQINVICLVQSCP